MDMPFYKVWYRNNPQPLEFSSAARVRDAEIVARIFQHENINPPVLADGQSSNLGALIAANGLAPVRYAEDEGEPFTIE
jgi:hypothetical protein